MNKSRRRRRGPIERRVPSFSPASSVGSQIDQRTYPSPCVTSYGELRAFRQRIMFLMAGLPAVERSERHATGIGAKSKDPRFDLYRRIDSAVSLKSLTYPAYLARLGEARLTKRTGWQGRPVACCRGRLARLDRGELSSK